MVLLYNQMGGGGKKYESVCENAMYFKQINLILQTHCFLSLLILYNSLGTLIVKMPIYISEVFCAKNMKLLLNHQNI